MDEIRRGAAPAREATILQVFLHASGYAVDPDGSFGPGTERALRAFQRDAGLIVDGVAGEKTWTALFARHPQLLAQLSAKWLSQQQIADFAQQRQLEVPTVRAVYAVEANGIGFVGLQPKILFEGHVFWRELKAAGRDPLALARPENSDILFPSYNPKSYVGGLGEWARLERAKVIDARCAQRAASWGLFQVLGLHAESLGYAGVDDFVAAMSRSEADHLDAFGRFIATNRRKGRSLLQWLQARNWVEFAAGYNGPAYKTNEYDTKLAAAYAKYAAQA